MLTVCIHYQVIVLKWVLTVYSLPALLSLGGQLPQSQAGASRTGLLSQQCILGTVVSVYQTECSVMIPRAIPRTLFYSQTLFYSPLFWSYNREHVNWYNIWVVCLLIGDNHQLDWNMETHRRLWIHALKLKDMNIELLVKLCGCGSLYVECYTCLNIKLCIVIRDVNN